MINIIEQSETLFAGRSIEVTNSKVTVMSFERFSVKANLHNLFCINNVIKLLSKNIPKMLKTFLAMSEKKQKLCLKHMEDPNFSLPPWVVSFVLILEFFY